MKFIKINSKAFSPKRLFTSKKDRSKLSRSEPPSFASGSSEEATTPTSVLPPHQHQLLSGDWSDFSDGNNDGRVSRKELEGVLGLSGADPPSEEELKMMLGLGGDGAGDGIVSVEMLMRRVGPGCETELRDTFEIFDVDQDGRITAEEILRVFTAIGDERCTLEDCRRMIAGVDKNGDGFVCFDDFVRMMGCHS